MSAGVRILLAGTAPGGRLLIPFGTESHGVPKKRSVPNCVSDRSGQQKHAAPRRTKKALRSKWCQQPQPAKKKTNQYMCWLVSFLFIPPALLPVIAQLSVFWPGCGQYFVATQRQALLLLQFQWPVLPSPWLILLSAWVVLRLPLPFRLLPVLDLQLPFLLFQSQL